MTLQKTIFIQIMAAPLFINAHVPELKASKFSKSKNLKLQELRAVNEDDRYI